MIAAAWAHVGRLPCQVAVPGPLGCERSPMLAFVAQLCTTIRTKRPCKQTDLSGLFTVTMILSLGDLRHCGHICSQVALAPVTLLSAFIGLGLSMVQRTTSICVVCASETGGHTGGVQGPPHCGSWRRLGAGSCQATSRARPQGDWIGAVRLCQIC